MIRGLRYISLWFWVTCLVSLPASFWALPRLTAWLSGIPMPVILGGIFFLTGLILGLGLDMIGVRRIQTLIREGELWERAGIQARAEKRYIRAMGVFDSAWISPWAARRSAPQLMEALARFFLTSGSTHPGFEFAAALNLKADPKNETLALLWLGRLRALNRADDLTQSVLTDLADAHYAHPIIARELVSVFLSIGRVDFSANRIYRYFLDHDTENARADEGIRSAILKLVGKTPVQSDSGPVLSLGEQSTGAGPIGSMTGSSTDIIPPYYQEDGRLALGGVNRISDLVKVCGTWIFSVLTKLRSRVSKLWGTVRENETLRLCLKWGTLGLLGLWLVFFVWNTLSHILQSTDEPAQRIEERILKPFTIQVAAYLKQSHAERYMAALEKKGIKASVKKTGAGGKTWYLVRISEFTDKKAAETFGNHLKSQKIIDDFFVSNK